MGMRFQPTRPLRGATRYDGNSQRGQSISTHAPLAGRDNMTYAEWAGWKKFQPTRPLRGATYELITGSWESGISTHAPLAGRDLMRDATELLSDISTHAPLAGRDYRLLRLPHCQVISTHAPLAGRDTASAFSPPPSKHFNPRAPCGARQGIKAMGSWIKEFQPTRPLRGATSYGRCCGGFLPISTHAPLAGRDHCGGGVQPSRYRISTHAPLAGRDRSSAARRPAQ